MPVYKRPDRTRPWYYQFMRAGETFKESGFNSRAEAEDAEARARIKAGAPTTHMAFSQMVNLRLDYVKAHCTPDHYRKNISRLKQFADWKRHDLMAITPDMVRRKMIRLSETMSNALANKHLIALKSVFEQAVNDGFLGRNPCRGVKFLPIDKFVKYVPPVEDIEKALTLADPLDRAYLTVIWQLGARVREVNQLTWEDVDFNKRLVRLWTRKKRGGNKTPRLVDMNGKVFQSLKFAQWHQDKNSPYVFVNPGSASPGTTGTSFSIRCVDGPE